MKVASEAATTCTAARYAVRELAGRGRGLVAVGDVASGEQLATFAAYSHTCDSFAHTSRSPKTSLCCATCLRWGDLPVRCTGCPAAYCSVECRAAADRLGHRLCCAALQRMHAMRPKSKKFSVDELSSACFLLRAFAQRASERQRAVEGAGDGGGGGDGSGGDGSGGGVSHGDGGGEPSFEDAVAQEEEPNHSASMRSSQERSVRLAKLQAARLIEVPAALRLLRCACCGPCPISCGASPAYPPPHPPARSLLAPLSPASCLHLACTSPPSRLHLASISPPLPPPSHAAIGRARVAARNQFHLFDEDERDRGSVMYPQARLICIAHMHPNAACAPACACACARACACACACARACRGRCGGRCRCVCMPYPRRLAPFRSIGVAG